MAHAMPGIHAGESHIACRKHGVCLCGCTSTCQTSMQVSHGQIEAFHATDSRKTVAERWAEVGVTFPH